VSKPNGSSRKRSAELGTTKTQLMVDAASCLRAAQIQALMAEGYVEMNEFDAALVEEGVAAGSECLPEWALAAGRA
jgi:hypothetical protein